MTRDDSTLSAADLVGLFCLAALLQGLLYGFVPFPGDYDQAYYLSVAQHIVAGEGARIGAVWNHTFTPAELPHAADAHWMPLPSRVLVLGEALFPGGYRLIGACLAGSWAPLAALLGRELGLDRRWAIGAGVAAAVGGGWAARIAAPDTYGLVGMIGGLALLFAARKNTLGVGVMALLMALSRTDGALFGLALALAIPGARALAPIAGAALGAAGWTLRNHLVFGEAFWQSRSAATAHTDYLAWASGQSAPALGVIDRMVMLPAHAVDVLAHWLMSGMVVGTALAALGMLATTEKPWVRAVTAYWLLLPVVATVLAPAVAWHGTVFRSTTAIAPALCALGALGALKLNRGLGEARELPPALIPTLSLALFALLSLGTGAAAIALQAREPDPCAVLADLPPEEPIFAYDALYVEQRCRRPAVTLFSETSPEERDALAARYGIRHALTAPSAETQTGGVHPSGPLQGWIRGGRLSSAPDTPARR
ncbi:MAG: hypothetical protein KC912_07050 [Proteobacteria bacterium]|nr:hypothetical protein [Pseudomonadota bacterium]